MKVKMADMPPDLLAGFVKKDKKDEKREDEGKKDKKHRDKRKVTKHEAAQNI